MELLYLWISNYRDIIINQGFNLSSRFIIKFDPLKKRIDIVDNENYIENLFHNDIIDIKGIVGENGSGKSTLLKYFVHECFTPKLEDPNRSANMIIYLSPGDSLNVIFVDKLEIDKENIKFDNKKFKIKIQSFTTELFWDMIGNPDEFDDKKCASFRNTSFVYFSDVVDLNETSESFNGLCNVCTNYLIGNDKLSWTNDPKSKFSELTAYKIKELDRQIDFVLSKNVHNFNLFKLPEFIAISTSTADYSILNDFLKALSELKRNATKDERLQRIFLSHVFYKIEQFERYHHNDDFINTMKNKFRVSFLFNHIRSLRNFDSIIKSDDILIKIGKCYFDCINNAEINFDKFLSDFSNLEKTISVNFSMNLFTEKIKYYLEFENTLFKDIIKDNPTNDFYWIDHVTVNVLHQKLGDLRNAYKQSITITDYLIWGWRDMSSGERGYLTIFSRLYSLNKRANDDFQKSSNLMIFLDEVELFFHPQWQKKLISFLISELPIIFPGKKSQIFITSHSPFILSDLPPTNAAFLRKGGIDEKDIFGNTIQDKCVVESSLRKVTFAANIHELLATDFFLTNGFIGDFAKSLIEDLVHFLKNEKTNGEWTLTQAEKVIAIIGDDLIKSRLKDLFIERFNKKTDSLKEKRSKLIKELREINKQINSDNDTD